MAKILPTTEQNIPMPVVKPAKESGPRIYVKPVFIKEDHLAFPMEIIEQFNGGRFCVQCSGCHGCR